MPAKIRPDEVTVVVPTLDSGAWIGRFVDCITEALPGSAVVLVAGTLSFLFTDAAA